VKAMRAHRGHIQRNFRQQFAPFQMRLIGWYAKRNMVDAARAHHSVGELGLNQNIDMAAERRDLRNKSDAIVFLTLLMESHGMEYVGGSFEDRFAKCDAVEATDCMLRWNCSSPRWQCFDRRVTCR